ncbi:hypothetical protein BFP72_05860 [Reichenbachiella sp. 5M10]|nr:hypothetical protein BFP72_05860 [Reichenbachiella sp. 5M10]
MVCLLAGLSSQAQVLVPGDVMLDYYRVIEMKNSSVNKRINIYPSIINQYQKDSLSWNPWGDHFAPVPDDGNYFRVLDGLFANTYITNYPRSYNDGAVWKGKGLTSELHGGITGRIGKFRYTFAPVAYFSQNGEFDLAPQSGNNNPYNYQFRNQRIDYVQRFGDDPFVQFNLGQSELRFVHRKFTLGISTENMVWGPAQNTPILMGNNSAGIPHVDIGTDQPVNTFLGPAEVKFYWGLLSESDYFDDDSSNDNRYWSGVSLGLRSKHVKGLSLGVHRAFYKRADEFTFSDIFISIYRFQNPDPDAAGNDEYDQMGAATIKWEFDEVGFETYIEFAKNDFGGGIFGGEPDHALGYTIGFSKLVDLKNDALLKFTYEHASVGLSKTMFVRVNNSWYTHGIVKQGYTQNGQIIAGGIGPGSNTDYLEIKHYSRAGMIGLNLQRIRFDDDYFFGNISDKFQHDFEWTPGIEYLRIVNKSRLKFDMKYSLRQNMYFIRENKQNNFYFGLSYARIFH